VLQPRKSLGQNFLTDPNTARKIVASLTAPETDPVIEIGPGTGALTHLLTERYQRFIAIEVDERAVALLRASHPDVEVFHQDILEVDWAALRERIEDRVHVIGNLPYYITSQILFALLDARVHIVEAVLMMQLEVAERLVAEPRTKAYGILSVILQLYTRPELLFKVSRNVFHPKPDVTSAVVRLTFEPRAMTSDVDFVHLKHVVRTAFNQRRKTLRNSIGRILPESVELPERWAGLRAEELTPEEFVELARWVDAAAA
jgi:16S rRNA (adenine1518-N6/adenine1519-N6)-dimethyltransferase